MTRVWTFFGANFSVSPRIRSASTSLLLAEQQLREIIVRFDVARILLDRLAQRMLGFLGLAVLLQQGSKIVVNLGIDGAQRQRFLIGVEGAVDVAGNAQRVAKVVQRLGHVRGNCERLAVIVDGLA